MGSEGATSLSERILGPASYSEFKSQLQVLQDPAYLRIDQSLLPLELFDSLLYQEVDKTPEQWLATGFGASVPFCEDGEWVRKPCEVLGYDSATQKYHVRVAGSKLEKYVSRLNLRFDQEDEKWEERVAAARAAQQHAKALIRYDHFVSQQSNDEIRPIHPNTIQGIHAKLLNGLSAQVQLSDQHSPAARLLKENIAEVIRWYTRSMKVAILVYKLRHGDDIIHKYTKLKLPEIPPIPAVPETAMVECAAYPRRERNARLAQLHISNQYPILLMFSWLYSRWSADFASAALMDVKLQGLTKPCQLTEFEQMQLNHREKINVKLQRNFRRAFMEQFVDTMQDLYDLFQSNQHIFTGGPLYRLLRGFDVRIVGMLRSLLADSIQKWVKFVESNSRAGAGNGAADTNQDCHATSSLFTTELVLVEHTIELHPSLEEIKDYLLNQIDHAIRIVRDLTAIDTDVMSLLQLPRRVLLNVGVEDPLFRDIDAVIAEAKAHLNDVLDRELNSSGRLVTEFQQFEWLHELDVEELIQQFSNPEQRPTIDDYRAKLCQLYAAAEAAGTVCYDIEDFGLVRIEAANIKQQLANRALELRNALLEHMMTDIHEQTTAIIQEYTEILDRIAEKPKDERELADLRQYIEDSKATIASLQQRTEVVRKMLAVSDEFAHRAPLDLLGLFWSTLEYPSTIDAAATDAEIALEGDKVRMMDKLALEKEKFDTDIEALAQAVKGARDICNYDLKEANVDAVNTLMDKIHDAQAKAADFNMREGVFGFPPTEYGILDTLIDELNPFYKLWNNVADFHSSKQDWLHGPFQELDGKKIEEFVTEWWKASYKLAKQLEGDAQAASECAMRLREETTEFRTRLPVIQALASKALKRRHWDLLSEQLGHVIDPDEDLTLQYLFEIKAAENIDSILEVTQAAEKEYNLEKSLAAMRQEWATIEFDVRPYKTTAVIGGLDDIITLLDDHLVKTQTMRGSPYVRPIETECRAWESRLKYAQSLLDAWLACQRTWMYLEPIFAADDIMRQLPTEARRFGGVDNLWRKTMSDALADANFMNLADPEKNLESKFSKANEKLEEIQKGLTDYLEMKRLAFPRFFFLSDEGLLEILSQTKNSKAVQPYLSSIFEGISSVTFADDLKITEAWSAEGELLPLQRFVDPESTVNKGNVERWLLELESIQWDSVKHQTTLALEQYTTLPRVQWVLNWPAQVVLAVSQVYWTREVTEALKDGGNTGLAKLYEFLNNQLRDIVQLVRGKLSKLERKTLTALTTIDVHARDVVQSMVDVRVQAATDFEWVSQLRYYWEPSWRDGQGIKKGEDTLVARIVNARCLYGYEYLGNTSRLVITPLTDRCYRTMIGAVDLLYGGAPEGPAGTGKTETVKDLSKAVAIHCVVFNCSDGLDYLAMAKFFKGLAGCGSWCCFDEFNRIHIEVLSVIAQQILEITNAKRENKLAFYFEGTHMKLNHNANVFITMNPGYAGRAELPDNLKALFRPCAMMVPDYALISEIRLYSFGFEDARSNAQKIVRVLQLSSEQLSSQKHYDYGMRAVNSILVAAGNLRQELGDDPQWTEAKIVLRSINDVNLPKFTVEDLPLFYGITSDLFPEITLPQKNYGCLPQCILDVCNNGVEFLNGARQQLQPTPQFTKKILELYEMILVRHGVMVVGETGSGKSATICGLAQAMTLANAQSPQFAKVEIHAMNPKAITCDQLYGYSDLNSHEWTDGVLAVIFRGCAKDTSPQRKWVLFDGPVDAVWIENMNTVLDDNKKLCLMSGEIIKMNDTMTMMFEAEDLEQASPATISRVGMIFCEATNIGWQALLSTWLSTQDEALVSHHDTITRLCNWLFEPLVFCVAKYCSKSVPLTTQETMQSLLTLFECFVDEQLERIAKAGGEVLKMLEGMFVLAVIWSLGASVEKAGRVTFERILRHILVSDTENCPEFQEFVSKNPKFQQQARATVLVLPDTSLYDHVFDASSCRWVSWYEGQAKLVIPPTAAFHEVVVPTVDSIRNEHLIKLLLLKGHHVLCTGETGTGKSVSLTKLLRTELPESYRSIALSFSAQTSANQVQDLIDSKLDKRRKGVYGPPLGTKCVIFVDDLNMPAKEEYGAQPPIELLRQWMDQGGWYDRSDNALLKLVDICFVAAMGPPGGGRSRITQRYVRHFNMLNFVPFNDESLTRVFGTILEWHLNKGFAASVKQMCTAVVGATIAVYNKIVDVLLPTPTKSHYTFNLRDMSKVFQGILQCGSEHIRERGDLVQLWLHESMRVFHDRLINEHDREWFVSCLTSTCAEVIKAGPDTVANDVPSLLYGNFGDPKATTKLYQKIDDIAQLQLAMQTYLEDHNAMSQKPMNLVLFRNAIEHIARISRIINQPYGNALLIGVGGSGRKSLTKLAIHIAEFELFEIEISKHYGHTEWREDIKAMMMKAGVENKSTVFLFDDTQIVKPSFLEDVNGMLNSGEVANLFKPDELAQLADLLAKPCQEAGVNVASQTEVYNFFISRCRSNLHLVLCLSPIGEAFRTRLRMFPSLVNCCTIDWFTAWPEEALRSVAEHFLHDVELDSSVKDGIVAVCVMMQEQIIQMSDKFLKEMGRHFYVTPTSYLELINTFQRLLAGQRAQVLEMKYRYENGLAKLRETEVQVAEMQRELEDLQPKLHDAKAATEELLKQIEADRIVANENRSVVEAEEVVCNQQKSEAEALKASCEEELAEALPAWEDATRALRSLSKNDIVEIKSMKKPVNAVKVVLQTVCIMMGVRAEKIKDPAGGPKKVEDYWGPAQKHLLGDSRLIQRLIDYDKDNIDSTIIEKITVFVNDPEFDPEFVRTKSVAAAGLCKWVHAMVKYDRVVKVVAPKRQALAEAEATLKIASDALAEKQAMLKEVIDKLTALEESLQEAEEKKRSLQNQVTECATKLTRAEALITGLGGEKTRWGELSTQLSERYENITGDIMLAAGVIAFLGAFTSQYRDAAIADWSKLLLARNITCSHKFALRTVLGDEVVIRNWVICRLPNDSFSIMNAIMLFHSNRWPLMIDPQGQANRWIKKMEEDNKLKVVKQNQATFVRTIENAIQFGNPVLLENVGDFIDPILDSVLLKQVISVGGVKQIRLGDNTIDYDDKFRLYITTKLSNPHYPPELCVKVNLLNFMATSEGLEDQMLGRVVAREQPELETQRQALILEDAQNKRHLKDIEDKILEKLRHAQGNILDDEVLIDTLAASKKTSNVIEEKMKVAATTQQRIARIRQGYVPVAFQSSQLFFCIADLAGIDPMYQYSLDWFMSIFDLAIDKAPKFPLLEDRLKSLNDTFTLILYENVCRSLFEKDKLLFSFLLTVNILSGKGELEAKALRFLLQGSTSMELAEPNPLPDSWLSDRCWGDILALGTLPNFESFVASFKTNIRKWKAIFEASKPVESIREVMGEDLPLFDELCILRAFRPDAVVPAIQEFVASKMGEKFIEPPPLDLRACFEDSHCATPLIFVLTPGADPMLALLNLASQLGYADKLVSISLGQGQGPLAENAIAEAGDKGSWVCLQNCHLSISWMPTLERLCEEFSEETLHPNFRLWLTSEPSPHFPSYILQSGVKMTNEPAKGMRANLLGSYISFTDAWLDGCSRRAEFKKLVFGLCFFHAVVRERRKFGPLGWNIQYVFSGPDLKISLDQLRLFLDELGPDDSVPYPALAYLAGECNYGGRVTDDKDRRCLVNILSEFYCPAIQDDEYKFSRSGLYYAPAEGDLESYKSYIRSLPYTEDPEVFGLHENANISCALVETNTLLTTALSLQPRTTSGDGASWEEKLTALAEEIGGRLPPQFDVEAALLAFPIAYEESMNTVLTQELLRFNTLMTTMKESLDAVGKALRGLVVLSAELEAMGNSMVLGQVPTLWADVAYPSLKPLSSWVGDLLARLKFLQDWLDRGSSPMVYWISGFFFTQAFITGVLQNYARKYHIPIDQVAFDFRVLSDNEMQQADAEAPLDGAQVRGLFLDGARWDKAARVMAEAFPRELHAAMPYIHLQPKRRDDVAVIKGVPELYTGSRQGTAHVYQCPVYKTSIRQGVLSTTGHSTNFVMYIRLPLSLQHDQKHWIKRGVALLTQLDN